jgi:hypothetical protein
MPYTSDPGNDSAGTQQDYDTRSDKTMSEHQKPGATACDLSSSSQSSSKPKQQA